MVSATYFSNFGTLPDIFGFWDPLFWIRLQKLILEMAFRYFFSNVMQYICTFEKKCNAHCTETMVLGWDSSKRSFKNTPPLFQIRPE